MVVYKCALRLSMVSTDTDCAETFRPCLLVYMMYSCQLLSIPRPESAEHDQDFEISTAYSQWSIVDTYIEAIANTALDAVALIAGESSVVFLICLW